MANGNDLNQTLRRRLALGPAQEEAFDPADVPERGGGEILQDSLRRALAGFGRGAALTPQQAGGDPGLGGVVGGLSAISESIAREDERASRAAEGGPAARAGRITSAQETARRPFRQAAERQKQAGRLELQQKRAEVSRERRRSIERARSQNPQLLSIAVRSVQTNPINRFLPEDEFFDAVLNRFQTLQATQRGGRQIIPQAGGAQAPQAPQTADDFIGGGGFTR